MTLFLGTHHNRLDKKGRVSIPAPFRSILEKLGTQDLVLKPHPLDPSVECWPQTAFEQFSVTATPDNPLEDPRDDLMMALFSFAEGLRPDVEGRVVLPAGLVAHAGLTDTVSFAGVGTHFQIWAPGNLAERQRAAFEKEKARLQALRDRQA
ncbi:division/cell wall cluster transcriptional repressor MraZ [Roseomonas sp. BN140053]|uniref:division/cell wall cluster transcriptional repressor MraZ n=1 Tax=Roseomonas sp. BN140053 TaxID=3391898 RepID=UPI0039EC4824